jgi:PAP2 superfamily
MRLLLIASQIFALALVSVGARAQTPTDMAVLNGLSPVSVLGKSDAGRSALGANYAVTGGIQTGEIAQPTLLPFAEQEQQSLRDAFITFKNLAELADGLGTTLGAAYIARLHYIDPDHTSPLPEGLGGLISYATSVTQANSSAGKFFFSNGTVSGVNPVSADAKAILTSIGGVTDIYGVSYGLPAGMPGGDKYGDPRPFQTEHTFRRFTGLDYFNTPSNNTVYNAGPTMALTDSPSFPSGHTTYGFTGAILLAVLIPERYGQMVVRGAEYGNDRILMGSHYAMDVLGGRTLALYDMAHLLANDTRYMNLSSSGAPISDFQAAVKKARKELSDLLAGGCGDSITVCATQDIGRFSNSAANEAFYNSTQTYSLPVVYPKYANVLEDVGKVAPEAGYLLTQAFPSLTLEQADRILTETEGPGGGFLDNGSAFGVYSRLNLYAASQRAVLVAVQNK